MRCPGTLCRNNSPLYRGVQQDAGNSTKGVRIRGEQLIQAIESLVVHILLNLRQVLCLPGFQRVCNFSNPFLPEWSFQQSAGGVWSFRERQDISHSYCSLPIAKESPCEEDGNHFAIPGHYTTFLQHLPYTSEHLQAGNCLLVRQFVLGYLIDLPASYCGCEFYVLYQLSAVWTGWKAILRNNNCSNVTSGHCNI